VDNCGRLYIVERVVAVGWCELRHDDGVAGLCQCGSVPWAEMAVWVEADRLHASLTSESRLAY
jgi:hypothetical protein